MTDLNELNMRADISDAPKDSYMGRERDLADMLTDETLDWLDTISEFDDFAGMSLFFLLMMNYDAARAMTEVDEAAEDLAELITACQDDARDDSGQVFTTRIKHRIEDRNLLRRIGQLLTRNE